MAKSSSTQNNHIVLAGLAAAAAAGLAYYWYASPSTAVAAEEQQGSDAAVTKKAKSFDGPQRSTEETPKKSSSSSSTVETDKTPITRNTSDEKTLHIRIEDLDKKGKGFFKNKQYLEAAEAFTEALNLIESHNNNKTTTGDESSSTSLVRQTITLMNNRSAMYEKGGMPELALSDCTHILERDVSHMKARTRKLRILEGLKQYQGALQEVCALQLLFMQANRENLRRGLPVPSPPVPQSKMEELLQEILPMELKRIEDELAAQNKSKERPLPSAYTILQLLKSYTGYNQWMSLAAKDGSVEQLTQQYNDIMKEGTEEASISSLSVEKKAQCASLLMKRGRRHTYDRHYELAGKDFEAAYQLVDGNVDVQDAMENDDYCRLLEWTGMSRHFRYNLSSALACYQKCADLEPTNALLLVKQAGVQMDAGKHDDALKLFDTALGLDPNAVDALLHRSNLRMLQTKPIQAQADLEALLKLRPNHVMARLRLASILAASNDSDGAKKQLDLAEQVEPDSSEVQSYRGELYFTTGDFISARKQFEIAMKMEPNNPTPYVNAAMAIFNTPPENAGQIPDAKRVMELLEQALTVDPQFTAAYIQLGQLKLGTATDLTAARQVIQLYDDGLKHCRSPEEMKELCSMRTLAVAQVDAAQELKMETFNLQ